MSTNTTDTNTNTNTDTNTNISEPEVTDNSKRLNEKTANIEAPADAGDETKMGENGNTYIFFITGLISMISLITSIYFIAYRNPEYAVLYFVIFLVTIIYVLLSLYLTYGYDSKKIMEKLQGPFADQLTKMRFKFGDYINSVKPISSLQGGNNPSSNLFPMPIAFFKVYTFYWLLFGLIFSLYMTSHYMQAKDQKAATAFLLVSMLIIGYMYISTMYDGSLEALKARKIIRAKTGKVDLSQGSKATALQKLIKLIAGRPDPAEILEPRNLQPFIYFTIIFLIGASIMFYNISIKEKGMAIFGLIIAIIGAILMYYCILANYYE